MDFFGNAYAINNAPDRVMARQMNRAVRREALYQYIGAAIGPTHVAQLSFALEQRDPNANEGLPIGHQHPGSAAELAVRHALSEYKLPTDLRVRYIGMQRFSGRGPYQMDEGVVTVEVSMRTISGIDRIIDIPVMVREGMVLEPVVFVHQGAMHTITQGSLDELIDAATFTARVPDRRNMYSPPPEDRRPLKEVPLQRGGLFGVGPGNRILTAAYVQSAMRGQYVTPLPPFQAAARERGEPFNDEYVSMAERPRPEPMRGDEVSLKRGIDVAARDGQRFHVAKGTKCTVRRDIAGDGREYFVYFPDLGFTARIRGDAI